MPVRAGRFIVHGQHDRARIPPNKLGIEIEAALAFGTGHHGTTRGCLLLLDHVLKALAPAARARSRHRHRRAGDRRGQGAAGRVLASDIDPRRCGSRTRMPGSTVPAISSDDLRDRIFGAGVRQRGPFDLVLANILANPLRQMATAMARHLAPSGAGDSVGAVAASGAKRDRGLSRARAGSKTAYSDRGLEQPDDAEGVRAASRIPRVRKARTWNPA